MKLKEKQEAMRLAAIDFSNGTPIQEVMAKYNVSYASVYNAVKRYNIDYKYTYGRTIFFDEEFFSEIDSEEKAYWLGFIFADGSVVKTDKKVSDYNRTQIGLSSKDRHHLEVFCDILKYPKDNIFEYVPPNSYASTPMSYLQLNSMNMAKDLINLGCIPNKTSGCILPDIPKHLIRHMIRGFFDGDGSINIFDRRQKKAGLISFTSEEQLLLSVQNYLMDGCKLNRTKLTPCKDKNASLLCYGGRLQLIRIFYYLYQDSTVFLQRKYDKFSLILL